jgi:hypothetical protein
MIQEQGRRLTRIILTRQVGHITDPREKLQAAVRTHLYLTEVMQEWFYFSYMEAKNIDKVQQKKAIESELATEQMFIDILEEGDKKGLFSVSDPVLTASVIKSMLQDWYVKRWKHSRRRISVDQYADFVIGFIESAVKKPVKA